MKKMRLFSILSIVIFSHVLVFGQLNGQKQFSPEFVAIAGSAQTLNTNTLNFTIPAGNSRLLLVFVTDEDAMSIASVSFGGMALTQRATGTDGVAVDSVWTLSLGSSAVGTTNNIVVLSTGVTPNESIFIGAVALAGVDQTTPVEGVQQRLLTAANASSSFNITSETGDMVFDYLDAYDPSPTVGEMQTPGMGQTQLHNADDVALMGGGSDRGYFQSSWRQGGAPTVPMSWATTNNSIQHIAFNVNGIGPTAANASISGRVLTVSGRGISRATVHITDQIGNIRTARTNQFGYYRVEGIEVGQSLIVNVFSKQYQFTTQVITLDDSITNLNFIAQDMKQ